jgi:hypothetical protein
MIDIFTLAERTNAILNNITDLVTETSECFIGENGTAFRKQFASLREKFPIINENILSYNRDLLTVKTNFANREVTLSDHFVEIANAVNERIN